MCLLRDIVSNIIDSRSERMEHDRSSAILAHEERRGEWFGFMSQLIDPTIDSSNRSQDCLNRLVTVVVCYSSSESNSFLIISFPPELLL